MEGPLVSEAQMHALSRRLASAWLRKDGDVLTELESNLKAPPAKDGSDSGGAVRRQLALVADELQRTFGPLYPTKSTAELLVMRLYTMAGPDIDALLGWEGVPTPDDKEAWAQYCAEHSGQRNSAVFAELNWACRTAAANDQDEVAWGTVQTWVKFLGVLCSVAEQPGAAPPPRLWRGLAGLKENVTAAHNALTSGSVLCWPAVTSAASDAEVAASYLSGAAANATKVTGGRLLFEVCNDTGLGVGLQDISRYPRESETLLPPLCVLRVDSNEIAEHVADCKHLRLTLTGTLPMSEFGALRSHIARDTARAAERLLKIREEAVASTARQASERSAATNHVGDSAQCAALRQQLQAERLMWEAHVYALREQLRAERRGQSGAGSEGRTPRPAAAAPAKQEHGEAVMRWLAKEAEAREYEERAAELRRQVVDADLGAIARAEQFARAT
eukprot:TRINITY_DN3966_c0_g1_i2.p1 TRINITY_DN3966_c0_g1~~TRINITY_DN3966_c0_g1_i2.p1  ORF type:complete len:446 (+),score=100.14 TRINITY_DN3966_c0_g1_i2:712-2049(+)